MSKRILGIAIGIIIGVSIGLNIYQEWSFSNYIDDILEQAKRKDESIENTIQKEIIGMQLSNVEKVVVRTNSYYWTTALFILPSKSGALPKTIENEVFITLLDAGNSHVEVSEKQRIKIKNAVYKHAVNIQEKNIRIQWMEQGLN